ncbi:helix-turn-helix domain-containing protein [Sediminibacillus massiliensis]|uniref:helix-turn-helix domain-containing protein n=1 Tax=Sediminibacillus massiliensis TaxID=1926277 RepID=UPI0009885AE6|nr:helix-turn-helix transcriptional regulator [Sediminibacillus massiliensis]
MIGDKIHKIRKRKGLTLTGLAEKANISKSYLSNIERNINKNPSIQVLRKIAVVLQVDMKMLINGEDEVTQQLEEEWLVFIKELKDSGVQKEQINDYRKVIQFIKWQNECTKGDN